MFMLRMLSSLEDFEPDHPFDSANIISKTSLRTVGMWPPDLCEEPTETSFLARTQGIFKRLTMLIVVWCTTSEFINLFCSLDDLQELIDTSCSVLPVMFEGIMIFNFMYKKETLLAIVQALKQCSEEPTSSKNADVFRDCYIYSRRFLIIFFTLCCNTALAYSSIPLVGNMLGYPRSLPMHQWYPYDKYQSPMYEVSYFLETVRCVNIALLFTGHDGFFCTALIFTCGAFEAICEDLRCIVDTSMAALRANGYTGFGADDAARFHREMYKQLCGIIHRHAQLIRLCEHMDMVFSPVVFAHFLMHSYAICVLCWQIKMTLAGEIHIDKLPLYLIYMSACIVELFVYCWYGQQLIVQSTEVSDAAFHCGWTIADTRFKTTLRFFMQRSQKPVMMTAMSFGVMSLESFVAILKTAMSYFTLLESIDETTDT